MSEALTKQAFMKKFPVDRTLTYDKAKERGYEWMEDIYIVDQFKIPAEIVDLLNRHLYMLGQTHDGKNNNGIGVYRKIR